MVKQNKKQTMGHQNVTQPRRQCPTADADAPDVDDAEDSVDIEEVDVCVPNCDGRLCGDDGCGNSCGQCATGQECEDGTCVKQCLKLNRTEVTASWKPIHGPDDPRGEFYYQEVEENGDVVSALRLEIRQFHPFNGPQGPGEYDIAFKEENGFGACTICVSFLIVVARLAVTGGCLQPREHL